MDKEVKVSGSPRSKPSRSGKVGTPRGKKGGSSEIQPLAQKVLPVYKDRKKRSVSRTKENDDNSGQYKLFSPTTSFYESNTSLAMSLTQNIMNYEEFPMKESKVVVAERGVIGKGAAAVEESSPSLSTSSESSSSNYDGSPLVDFGNSYSSSQYCVPNGCIDIHGSNIKNNLKGAWKKNLDGLYRMKRDNRSLSILQMCKDQDSNVTLKVNKEVNIKIEDDNDDNEFSVVDVNLDDWLAPLINESIEKMIEDEIEESGGEEEGEEEGENEATPVSRSKLESESESESESEESILSFKGKKDVGVEFSDNDDDDDDKELEREAALALESELKLEEKTESSDDDDDEIYISSSVVASMGSLNFH